MTDLRQAAQQALEALDSENPDIQLRAALTLKAALEQPEQEPVGWEHHEYRPYGGPGQIRIHAVLASQYRLPDGSVSSSFQWLVDQYKADKNTIKLVPLYTTPPAAQPAPVQEPVAYLCENAVGHKYFRWKKPSSTYKPIALYTTLPAAQRPWQGLTDEDMKDPKTHILDFIYGARWAEAKLKERNT